MHRLLAACLALLAAPALAQEVCGGPDAPCEIDGGSYHVILPAGWQTAEALPALVHFHGFNSSAASVFRSGGLRRTFVDGGYVLIAPNGARRGEDGPRAWPARPGAGPRDDVAFTLAVLDDVAARVPIDPDRVYVSGFSAGGSMAWMVACYAADRVAGAASVSGALRRPVPDGRCPSGPIDLLQIHGFIDNVVPLEGRAIRDWHQGSVFESFALARATNGCASQPDGLAMGEAFWCRSWESCESGKLRMCLHAGGHGLVPGWTELARDWFERD